MGGGNLTGECLHQPRLDRTEAVPLISPFSAKPSYAIESNPAAIPGSACCDWRPAAPVGKHPQAPASTRKYPLKCTPKARLAVYIFDHSAAKIYSEFTAKIYSEFTRILLV